MKTTVRTLLIVIVLALSATVASAGTSSYVSDPFWMPDPLDPGQPAPDPATPPDTAVPGYWWRDTTNQNAIAQHTEDEFTGTVYQPFGSSKLKVMVYSSRTGPNSVALVGPSSYSFYLVGPGGGRDEANAAKMAFQAFYPSFVTKTCKGLVLTGATPEETWGGQFWRNAFPYNPPFPIYANAAYTAAMAERDALGEALAARERGVFAGISYSVPSRVGNETLPYDRDTFLGAGSVRQYEPLLPFYVAPTDLVSEDTTLYLDSNIPVELRPTSDGSAGLLVWLPNQSILIARDAGQYLPDAGSIRQAGPSVLQRIAALDQMIALAPAVYIPMNGQSISGADAVASALTAQRDALQSIYDQTVARISAGDTIDEAAAAVTLPADLAASPYNQEFVSTVAGIVRNIYHEKLGWFGGETHELASTLTPAAKAAALAEAMGGTDALLAAARTAELNARDLAGAEKALYLAEAAHEAAPENFTARRVYAQALRKNAFMQQSAQLRNYYLIAAHGLGTDFVKSADEDTAIAFTYAEFELFADLPWPLNTVTFLTLPSADSGTLALAGVPVTAGQEIGVGVLDGLVFTPTANWNGETGFTWQGRDNGNPAESGVIPVTLIINPVDDAPATAPIADVVVDEDAVATTIDLAAVFTDAEGDALAYAVDANSNPALVAATLDGAILTLDFQAEQNGTATITVSASEMAGEEAAVTTTGTFDVTVNPVNDAPSAAGQTQLVTAGLARTFTLNYGDVETARADLAVTFSGPSVGTLDTSALPLVTYTAPADYIGPDSFTYTVTDRGDPDGCSAAPCTAVLTAQATVSLDVAENSIKGRVYDDANANGSPDEGEGGVAGVTVRLISLSGGSTVELVSAADGTYAFGSLQPGTYQVRQVLLPGYVQTTADPADIDLLMGQAVGGVDFGVVQSADLSVTMTADVNDKTIIYTFVVANNGPAEALEAVLINLRPHGVTYTSIITTQGVCQGGQTVTCEFGPLAAGESATVTIQANRTDKNNAIVNSATVASSTFDIALPNNSATTTVE